MAWLLPPSTEETTSSDHNAVAQWGQAAGSLKVVPARQIVRSHGFSFRCFLPLFCSASTVFNGRFVARQHKKAAGDRVIFSSFGVEDGRSRPPTPLLRALALGRCGGVGPASCCCLEPHVPPVRVLWQLTTTRRAWLPKSPLLLFVINHALDEEREIIIISGGEFHYWTGVKRKKTRKGRRPA
jgi:hypothetical protein